MYSLCKGAIMSKIKFFTAKTITDVDAMDQDEVMQGYLAGYSGEPKPTDSRDKWHGWRNGMADSGRIEIDESQRSVARQYVRGQS